MKVRTGAIESRIVEDVGRRVTIEVLVAGNGDEVLLVPSAMRGAGDFDQLQIALADAGYRSFAINLRGVGASTPPTADICLHDLTDDVAFVVSTLGRGRAHLVGHALGNTVVRATASYRPEVAATVTVMPCGGHNLGKHPVSSNVLEAFAKCHDSELSEEERIDALRIAFFAPGNDPQSWLEGWWPTSTLGTAILADPDEWWRAGGAPILIMQPREDAMAPITAGREAAAAFGDRATYVEVPRCGHAILPEQPEVIAANLVAFLRANPLAS